MTPEFEGLCNSDGFSRRWQNDHWEGVSKRNSRKGPVTLAWNHVSPSQIESFQKCKRSWFFKSIIKFPEGQKGFQGLGEAFHLINENVTQGMSWPLPADVPGCSPEDWQKATQMANQFLPLFPTETRPFKREHGLRLETFPGGPTMVGYIDLAIPPGVGWPAFLVPANEAIVADYKTLSDFRYMKTPAELADSVQMMTYAKWAIEQWPMGLVGENEPTPETIRVMHIYARTKPPFTRSAIRHESAIVTPSEINTRWEKTLDIVREMQQVSACSNFEDVEANGALNGHCEAYGGCTFRDKCGIAKVSGIKSLFQISKKPETKETPQDMSGSSVLDRIRAAQAANAAKAGSASPVTPNQATPAATSPVGPISGLLARLNAQGKGSPVLTGELAKSYALENKMDTAGPITGGGEYGKYTVSNLPDLLKLSSGVMPPDASSRRQEVITTPGTIVADPELALNPTGDESEEDEVDTTPVPQVSENNTPVAQVSSDIPVPTKKRGRPSNAEIAARNAAIVASGGVVPQAPAVTVKTETNDNLTDATLKELLGQVEYYKNLANASNKAVNNGSSVSDGLTLYVDCFPTKGDREVVDFFEWIGPICAQVAQSNAVGDYRLVNYTAKGLLAAAIRETVKEHGTPKSLTISSYAGGADIALEVLTPIAKRVIKKL